jgi:hypothetical protein
MKLIGPAFLALVIFLSQLVGVAIAQPVDQISSSETELDDILGGFDESDGDPEATDESQMPVAEPSRYDLTGSVTLGASYNHAHKAPESGQTDHRGLSRFRIKGGVELDVNLAKEWKGKLGASGFHDFAYEINGREEYTDQLLDKYESETKLKEAYVQGSLISSIDIKIGRQVVVWGKSDNIRITDILNPIDNRVPGLVDIEDLREPIAMSRLDYYFGKWSVSAIAIHEIRFNDNPVYGSDFFPGATPLPNDDVPDSDIDNTEYAIALNGIFSGYDIAFYFADLFDDAAHLEIDSFTRAPGLSHSRITMLGASANIALGNWLIKSEAAQFEGLDYSLIAGINYSRLDSLIGLEYSGITDNTFSVELARRHIFDFDSRLEASGVKEDEYQTAIRYQGDFINSTLHAVAVASFFGSDGNDGAFGRLSLKYDVRDSLSATGGIVWYQSGDNLLLKNIEDNDRIFIDIKYSF